MFSENRSELSIPVVGFLLLGFAALFAGIFVINFEYDFLEEAFFGLDFAVFLITGLLLMLGAVFAFRQVFLIEGIAFGIFGILAFAIGYGGIVSLASLGLLGFALAVIAAILAFMAFRVGDLYITLIGIAAIVALVPMYFTDSAAAVVISGIGFLAVAAIALIYAIMDWMLVQDIASEIAEYMYGDDEGDECGCGCGCEEHSD